MVVNDQSEGFRAFTCDTRTGKIAGNLPVVEPKWGLRLNAGGTLTASVPATALEAHALDIKAATTPLRRSLGFSYGGNILECGPILSRTYDEKTRRLELTASGLWSIFDRRKVLPGFALVPGVGIQVTHQSVNLGPLSLGSIARELVRLSLEDNPYGLGDLNVVLPAVLGGEHVRNYPGYELKWIGDALRDLTEVADGPDIRFRPRFMGNDPTRVEWVMETGDPYLSQTGQDWLWDGSRPQSPVVGFGATEDASGIATRAWVPGSGQEFDMKLSQATNEHLVAEAWPWTEADEAAKDVDDGRVLAAHARALADLSSGPEIQFSLTVRADGAPRLGEYLPGDFADVVIPQDHPLLNGGKQRVRIMALDGDGTNQVSLTVASLIGQAPKESYGETATVAAEEQVPEVPYPDSNLYPTFTLYPA